MQSSFLNRIFPPSGPILPRQHHPTSRSALSTPPPAISPRSPPVASPLSPPTSGISAPASLPGPQTSPSDPLLPVKRAAKTLQHTIQSLLDAQSDGLLAGITSSSGQGEIPSDGSVTPTPTISSKSTLRKATTVPVRQPREKKISLRGARRGLSRSMHDFIGLKQEEKRILSVQIREREEALHRVEAFTNKRQGLQIEIASITSERSAQSVSHLRDEADNLDYEIRQLENRLSEMRARHRLLVDEAQQIENSVQSRLSSFTASIDLLDREIRQFLARPPVVEPSSAVPRRRHQGSAGSDNVYALNPKRRTLTLISEHWRSETEELKKRTEAIEHEKTALEDGVSAWRTVVTDIQTFEQRLKEKMRTLSIGSISQQDRDDGMTAVLDDMDKTMALVENRLREAEKKDWKLLICCIGAELEAFREGREILIDAAGFRDRHFQADKQQTQLLDHDEDGGIAVSVNFPPDSPDDALFRQPEADSREHMRRSTDLNTKPTLTTMSSPPVPVSAPASKGDGNSHSTHHGNHDGEGEAEDEDPGPDFLISHT